MGKKWRPNPGIDLEGLLRERSGAKRGVVGDVLAADLHIDQVARDLHAHAPDARDVDARAGIDHDAPGAHRLDGRIVGEVLVGSQTDQPTRRGQARAARTITLKLDRLASQPDFRWINRLRVEYRLGLAVGSKIAAHRRLDDAGRRDLYRAGGGGQRSIGRSGREDRIGARVEINRAVRGGRGIGTDAPGIAKRHAHQGGVAKRRFDRAVVEHRPQIAIGPAGLDFDEKAAKRRAVGGGRGKQINL